MTMRSTAAFAAFVLCAPAFAGGLSLHKLSDEIDRVDREDMRTKSGAVHGDTLTLRVEDHKRSRGRSAIYGKDVEIDVSSLEESAEIQAGDAATLKRADNRARIRDQELRAQQVRGDGFLYQRIEDHASQLRQADGAIRHDVRALEAGQLKLGLGVAENRGAIRELGAVVYGNAARGLRNEQRIGALEDDVAAVRFALDEQRQRYREAIAGATAIGMVQQNPSANGVQLSASVGHFQGQSAGAVVIGTRLHDRVFVNAGASYGAATTYGASATVRLGGDLFVVSRRK